MAPALVWINGPFGGGKTQTAYELHRRLPGSWVADPERLGFGMHRMLPREHRKDFQDFAAWRRGVWEVLDHLLRCCAGTDRTVIAPMTLVVPAYFEETLGKLRADGHAVHHFALLASKRTVERRLRHRMAPLIHGESWALRQIDRCLDALQRPEFREHVDTDGLGVAQVAEQIARGAGLPLLPESGGRLRGGLRRAWVSAKHIRLG